MVIRLITPGKTRKAFLKQAEEYYLKLLIPYFRTEYHLVKTVPLKEGRNEEEVIAKESAALLKAISAPRDSTFLMDISGTTYSSPQLAQMIQKGMTGGTRYIDFIIGGVLGVDDSVRQRAGRRFSLSPMTFTHEMTRMILLEQLYRAADIIRGGKYHK